mgnify:CR=1 FL=1
MFFIVGSGHCGTRWLSTILHQPQKKIACFHEFRNEACGYDWIKGITVRQEQGLKGFYHFHLQELQLHMP